MNIHEIIAAAKRSDEDPEFDMDREWFLLREHAIAMAEALLAIADQTAWDEVPWWTKTARDALAAIEKDYNP